MTVSEQRTVRARGRSRTSGSAFVILTFEFHKEGHLWVGRCRELGTVTDGRSLEKVEAELVELVLLHVSALEEVGERERFFREHRIKLYTTDPPTEVRRRVPVSDQPTLVRFKSLRLSTVGDGRGKELAGV